MARDPRAPRLLIVTDTTEFHPPFTGGGTERQLSELAFELARDGIEVSAVARVGDASIVPAEAAGSSFPITHLGPGGGAKGAGWATLLPNALFVMRVFLFLVRYHARYDVLLVSGFRQLALPSALVARLTGKRCIVRIESAWDLQARVSAESEARMGRHGHRLVGLAIRAVRRAVFRWADHTVAFSDDIKTQLVEMGATLLKIRQIPNGVDTTRFAPAHAATKRALRMQLGLPQDKTLFVFTGRICRSKGVLDLLRLWQTLVHRSDLHLVLVGSGAGSHDNCEPRARELMAAHPQALTMTGAVNNVEHYLQACDAFIFLSHFEAFSLSILEALASGLPSIVTDVGGAREVIRPHAWGTVVPIRAATERLSDEVDWLLSRKHEWPVMGKLAREAVMYRYSMATVARQYAALVQGA
ncbi:MAG: glycosyltransferase family 4 protein [Steroidobacteraceae bacterium]